ncbi:MAG: SWIM zinc finger family protein [Deltaproteobacteria bacterium]|nr:SWIM zinc finger family protein [Deltaproteobacteria bacterium]
MYRWRYRNYTPSRPREAKGGIKAQSKSGKFGESWWAKRWIGIIESFNIGARLGRGKSYARKGQVLSIDIEKGAVAAQVQGSRARPYKVEMQVKTLTENQWKLIGKKLCESALFAARLLAGEMPQSIEEAFNASKVPLFPTRSSDIKTDCSCPDWSNPCKHIAAVHYLLGEEFDRDPFLIFKLRGLERDELISLLSQYAKAEPRCFDEGGPSQSGKGRADAPEPLPKDPALFWGGEPKADETEEDVDIPKISAALVKRLGGFPFWRGEESFPDVIDSIVSAASPAGLEVFLGEWKEAGKR